MSPLPSGGSSSARFIQLEPIKVWLRQATRRVTVAVRPHDRRLLNASRQDCLHAADRPPMLPQVSRPTTLLANVLACRAAWHSQVVT